ncbi:MAG TPA: hypothetical protein VHY21_18635 [Pseudonocardiaceae bacterium]|jgi:hypothetical protein|nr:hypothetical protein [Pseudonocardiaceae bacterium]
MRASGETSAKTYLPRAELIEAHPGSLFAPACGVPLGYHYLIAILQAPETGRRWNMVRSLFPDRTRRFRALNTDREPFGVLAEEFAEAYSGPVQSGCFGKHWGFRRPDGAPLLMTSADDLEWTEGDLVRVSGRPVGRATRLAIVDVDVPLVCTVRPFLVTGTVAGHPVRGALFHEAIHMPAGRELFPSPYTDRLQRAWCQFVTEFEDGTVQAGDLLWGHDGFSALVVQSTDTAGLVSTDVEANVEVEGDPAFPGRAVFTAADQRWVWEPAPRGGCWPVLAGAPVGHRMREGVVRQAGETRTVAVGHSILEAYTGRL